MRSLRGLDDVDADHDGALRHVQRRSRRHTALHRRDGREPHRSAHGVDQTGGGVDLDGVVRRWRDLVEDVQRYPARQRIDVDFAGRPDPLHGSQATDHVADTRAAGHAADRRGAFATDGPGPEVRSGDAREDRELRVRAVGRVQCPGVPLRDHAPVYLLLSSRRRDADVGQIAFPGVADDARLDDMAAEDDRPRAPVRNLDELATRHRDLGPRAADGGGHLRPRIERADDA